MKCVEPEERHNFLLTFLTDAPEMDMFENEFRRFPICSVYSSINIAEQRVDMKERTVDCVEDTRHSLLRCLSKEIFGSENHFETLMKELTNELMQNMEQYLPFIRDVNFMTPGAGVLVLGRGHISYIVKMHYSF